MLLRFFKQKKRDVMEISLKKAPALREEIISTILTYPRQKRESFRKRVEKIYKRITGAF